LECCYMWHHSAIETVRRASEIKNPCFPARPVTRACSFSQKRRRRFQKSVPSWQFLSSRLTVLGKVVPLLRDSLVSLLLLHLISSHFT